MSTLSDSATAAGLANLDLLKLARIDIPPEQALQELRGQFPGAFAAPFNARTATKQEYDQRKREMIAANLKANAVARDADAMAGIERRYGRKDGAA